MLSSFVEPKVKVTSQVNLLRKEFSKLCLLLRKNIIVLRWNLDGRELVFVFSICKDPVTKINGLL